METKKYICVICEGDASDNIQPEHDAYPGWQCCKKHWEYKYISYFMFPFVKKELGLPYIDALKDLQEGAPGFMKAKLDCNVCGESLTDEEIGKIKSTDENFYCTKHEEVKFCYAREWAKAWFVYKKEVNPNAIAVKDSEDWIVFSKWYLHKLYPNSY